MSYQVLSRKWRPQVFEDLIGQAHVAQTLQNALDRGRIAHAYIFTGPRGVGKTTTARILAKALNCPNSSDGRPCNDCQICQEITRGNNLDVLEIDGASNRGIDEIRELREAVKYPPTAGKYRIYIIDEVHMLTTQAFNALLKTLEEPPSHIMFILATTDPQKVPQTILSRTQRFDFRRIATTEIIGLMKKVLDDEKVAYEEPALATLARKADGSIRDGLSLLDQVIAYHSDVIDEKTVVAVLGLVEDEFYARLLESISKNDRKEVLALVEKAFDGGYDIKEVTQGFNQFLRDGILSIETGDAALTSKGMLVEIPEGMETADLISLLNIGMETESQLRYAQQPRVLIEHTLLKMASLDRVVSIQQVLAGITANKGRPTTAQTETDAAAGSTSPSQPRDSQEKTQTAEDIFSQTSEPPRANTRTFVRRTQGQNVGDASEDQDHVSDQRTPQSLPPDALNQIKARWETILGEVAKHSQGTAATLTDSAVAALEGTSLTIHLPARQSIHLKLLMDKRELVEQIIKDTMGWQIQILPTIPETTVQESHSKDTSSEEKSVLDELIDTFKGEEY
ncbi:MAG: DNA polymerase III subunit gamma/tau [Fidelibacterota bacterium]|nr:MAG: DNA polymerase III subunit gamma/tau [Candidatus Neomarinimicrobiota bacterium]